MAFCCGYFHPVGRVVVIGFHIHVLVGDALAHGHSFGSVSDHDDNLEEEYHEGKEVVGPPSQSLCGANNVVEEV